MDKTWTAADAQLLRELRTATGMDRATFARRSTLSIGQLTELEEGGSGRFYTDSIKAHTGHTLLTKLGHVRRVVEADRMDAVTAPTPAPQAGAAPAALRQADAPESSTEAAPMPAAASQERGNTWVGFVVVSLVVIGALAWLNRPAATKPAPAAAAAPEPMAEGATVPAAATASQEPTDAAPAPVSPTPVSPVVAAAASTQETSAATEAPCPPAGGAPASFTPDRALKPSSYVYLEAQQATVVCVTDANQKKSAVRLKAGERINVNGAPPFTVQAERWADVRVFFQGVRVPLEDPGVNAGGLLLQAR